MKIPRLPAPLIALLAWAALTLPASAHHLPPHLEEVDEFATENFMSALVHPFTGWDHIALAFAVGMLVARLSPRQGAALGAVFLAGIGIFNLSWGIPGALAQIAATACLLGLGNIGASLIGKTCSIFSKSASVSAA